MVHFIFILYGKTASKRKNIHIVFNFRRTNIFELIFVSQELKQVVLDVLRQALGNKFTTEAEEAWRKTIDAAYTHIFKGLST